jgi:hypothetical protein
MNRKCLLEISVETLEGALVNCLSAVLLPTLISFARCERKFAFLFFPWSGHAQETSSIRLLSSRR